MPALIVTVPRSSSAAVPSATRAESFWKASMRDLDLDSRALGCLRTHSSSRAILFRAACQSPSFFDARISIKDPFSALRINQMSFGPFPKRRENPSSKQLPKNVMGHLQLARLHSRCS